MPPDSRHAKAPGLRLRTFASPQTIDARWLPIRPHAPSSTHQWRGPARERRPIATSPFSSSLAFLLSGSMVMLLPHRQICHRPPLFFFLADFPDVRRATSCLSRFTHDPFGFVRPRYSLAGETLSLTLKLELELSEFFLRQAGERYCRHLCASRGRCAL